MSHRRYKVGLHPAYDSMFDAKKSSSGILNRGQSGVSDVTFDLWSETGLRNLLDEYKGNLPDGQFDDGRQIVKSRLKDAEERLAAIDVRWENRKIMAIRSGKPPVTEIPEEWVQEKLTLEARLDILKTEVDWLKKELAKQEAREQTRNNHLILARGPAGSAAGVDPPRSIDGQKVVWNEKEGHFLIDCPKSPYHQMRLPDYYVYVVNPWRTKKRQLIDQLQAKINNLDLSEGERARAGEEAARLRRSATDPPWPPKPEGS